MLISALSFYTSIETATCPFLHTSLGPMAPGGRLNLPVPGPSGREHSTTQWLHLLAMSEFQSVMHETSCLQAQKEFENHYNHGWSAPPPPGDQTRREGNLLPLETKFKSSESARTAGARFVIG